MAEIEVVPLTALGWDFRIESAGAPAVTLELGRFRDRGSFTWGGSEHQIEGRGVLRRSYTLGRRGVIVARAQSLGLLRRSWEVTAAERKLRLRRQGFLGRSMRVEQGRERLGEIRRTSLLGRAVSASIDDRIEGGARIFLVFLALVEWRHDARRHR